MLKERRKKVVSRRKERKKDGCKGKKKPRKS